jgi:hypothetical protein
MNFLKRLWYRLIGKSVRVSFLALPITDLSIKFAYQVGKEGEWKKAIVTVSRLLATGKTPVETVMDKLDPNGVYHVKLLTKAPKSALPLLNNETQTQEFM